VTSQDWGHGDRITWDTGEVHNAVNLTDDEFDLLYTYLDRQHRTVWDPQEVGRTVNVGEHLWRRVQEIAQERAASGGPPAPSEDEIEHITQVVVAEERAKWRAIHEADECEYQAAERKRRRGRKHSAR
jgi:hypothetical protein